MTITSNDDILTAPFTFMTDQQIWGDGQGNGQLQVMKAYGTKTGVSDLAIVLGGYTVKTSNDERIGFFWSASSDGNGDVRSVDNFGYRSFTDSYKRLYSARPALPSSVTSLIKASDVSAEALAKGGARLTKEISGVDVVEFGEYPQTIAAKNIANELEQAFLGKQLKTTGKEYTFDAEKYDAYDKPFKAKEYAEYEHKGKRYIRVEAQPDYGDSVLSNGHTPAKSEACWIEVKPIEWLKDPSGVWVAKQALFSGVQFDKNESYDGKFENTLMHRYLNTHFYRDSGLEALLQNKQAASEIATEEAAMWAAREATPKGFQVTYDGKGVLGTNNRDFAAGRG